MQQCLDREPVPEIMQARAAAGVPGAESDLSRERIERPVDLAFVQSVAVLVHQERAFLSAAEHTIPPPCVICQNLASGSMQRYQPRLAELGSANDEHPFGPVQILHAQVERLT